MKILNNVTYGDVIDKILEQKVVAIFQGRSEAGARALGNRSLLFDPRNKNGKYIVNTIKRREEFRPFAGSVLNEYASEWFHTEYVGESPYMSYSLRVKEDKIKEIPAVTHVDNTCRIQTVKRIDNPHYHKLISEFYIRTGVPLLLNTSFNLAGDPMVETPEDALHTLKNSAISYVYFPEIDMLVDDSENNISYDDDVYEEGEEDD